MRGPGRRERREGRKQPLSSAGGTARVSQDGIDFDRCRRGRHRGDVVWGAAEPELYGLTALLLADRLDSLGVFGCRPRREGQTATGKSENVHWLDRVILTLPFSFCRSEGQLRITRKVSAAAA